jgi:hypothetical protein
MNENHWLWADHNARFVWWTMLSMATWKPTKLRSGKSFIDIAPGTIVTSVPDLISKTGLGEIQIRRVLEILAIDKMISDETSRKGRVITISNWMKYQDLENDTIAQDIGLPSDKHRTAIVRASHEHRLSKEIKKLRTKEEHICDCVTALAPVDADAKKIFDSESEIPETKAEISVDFSGEKSLPLSSTETSHESTEGPTPVSQGRLALKSTSCDEQAVKTELPDTNRIPAPTKKRKRADVSPEEANARSETRLSYVDAFQARYSTKPIIAAKENTQIKNLVLSVGQQDAPFLVKFYLECDDDYLVNKCHPIGVLASNPTEYMVRWKKGQTSRPAQRFGYGTKRPDARLVHQCLPEPDDGDDMLPWDREALEATKLQEAER